VNANYIPVLPVFLRHIASTPDGAAVFLSCDAKTFVIHVDAPSCVALTLAATGKRTKRPLTHDLLELVLNGFDASLERVLIQRVEKGVYYTQISLIMKNELGTKIVNVDARPSDALVLALRKKRPVLATREVIESVEDMGEVLEKILRAKSSQKP
jgi:bifunctional DNase/RNase